MGYIRDFLAVVHQALLRLGKQNPAVRVIAKISALYLEFVMLGELSVMGERWLFPHVLVSLYLFSS